MQFFISHCAVFYMTTCVVIAFLYQCVYIKENRTKIWYWLKRVCPYRNNHSENTSNQALFRKYRDGSCYECDEWTNYSLASILGDSYINYGTWGRLSVWQCCGLFRRTDGVLQGMLYWFWCMIRSMRNLTFNNVFIHNRTLPARPQRKGTRICQF